ncbi:MAG: 50S ribosomal protein L4 [Coprothermobacterota bacterium]|jgi:large subunit ribosomal protein L4|nr:50S ribosomal protein L4 [Caldisericota bacterium]MDI6869161.1 50S ribosomal protein L4 [Coprothermobacterota bacterium]
MSEITVPLYDPNGQQTGVVELPQQIFGVESHRESVLRALRRQMANKRRGTASTLTRGEVAGGGKKPYPQKGTGHARQGSIRSPLWPGGGITFGPRPRSYEVNMPKEERRKAIFSLLSDKAGSGSLCILNLENLEPKTKNVVSILQALGLEGKVLMVVERVESEILKAARNIPYARAILWQNINVKDLLDCDYLVLSQKALARIKEVWG